MNTFLKEMKTVAEWLVGMLGDLVDIASKYPFMVIILIAGVGYLVFDHILLLFSGHGATSGFKAAKGMKIAAKKGQAIGIGKISAFGEGKHRPKKIRFAGSVTPFGYSSVVGGSKFRKVGGKNSKYSVNVQKNEITNNNFGGKSKTVTVSAKDERPEPERRHDIDIKRDD